MIPALLEIYGTIMGCLSELWEIQMWPAFWIYPTGLFVALVITTRVPGKRKAPSNASLLAVLRTGLPGVFLQGPGEVQAQT